MGGGEARRQGRGGTAWELGQLWNGDTLLDCDVAHPGKVHLARGCHSLRRFEQAHDQSEPPSPLRMSRKLRAYSCAQLAVLPRICHACGCAHLQHAQRALGGRPAALQPAQRDPRHVLVEPALLRRISIQLINHSRQAVQFMAHLHGLDRLAAYTVARSGRPYCPCLAVGRAALRAAAHHRTR